MRWMCKFLFKKKNHMQSFELMCLKLIEELRNWVISQLTLFSRNISIHPFFITDKEGWTQFAFECALFPLFFYLPFYWYPISRLNPSTHLVKGFFTLLFNRSAYNWLFSEQRQISFYILHPSLQSKSEGTKRKTSGFESGPNLCN